jgi:PKD domain
VIHRVRRSAHLLVIVACVLASSSVRTVTRTAPLFGWDQSATDTVTGYGVTVDGVRTDYGLTPEQSDGTCGCSVTLPFTSGRHIITVIASNSFGETPSGPYVVGPTSNPGGPYSGLAGTALAVSGASSTDNVGTITTYTWNWGDGSSVSSSSSATASHVYASAGIFTITLTVADDFNASHAATTTATITTPAQPPGVPGSPYPVSGATGVITTPTLTWTSTGATSYDVQFGTTNPPPQVATGQTTATYTHAALTAGTTYFWRIVAHNSAGATSGPVWSFSTSSGSSTVPAPWLNQDIGNTGLAGAASYASGVFTVDGAGADIWGTTDAFQFVYQGIAGDAEIVARVTSIENTQTYAKAGVMIRESLAANAAHAMFEAIPNGNIEFLTRPTSGALTTLLGRWTQSLPTWLKLTRSGSTFVGSMSADGVTWRTMGSVTVSMAANAVVGLVVTSHDATVLNTSTFDHVSVSAPSAAVAPAAPASPNPSDGAVGVSSSPTLTWTAAGATSYDVRLGTSSVPPLVATAQPGSSFATGQLIANTKYFWQIVAHNSNGTTTGPVWSFTTASSPLPTNIVIYASDIPGSNLHGAWTKAADSTSPNGVKLVTADSGISTTAAPAAAPTDYIDVPFEAAADTPYTLWMRLGAASDSKWNDSVWVQFSDAQVNGAQIYPLDSTSALLINGGMTNSATSVSGWGWHNGAFWLTQTATVTFATSGTHLLRIQLREDGVQFDQIVLSPSTYLASPPGPPSNDTTIVPK